MKEQNEVIESLIREAMHDKKLDLNSRDKIWDNIRKNRSESAARGRRRHMEKIIAAYVGAAAVFMLSITVGVGLWSKFSSGKPPVDFTGYSTESVGTAPPATEPVRTGTPATESSGSELPKTEPPVTDPAQTQTQPDGTTAPEPTPTRPEVTTADDPAWTQPDGTIAPEPTPTGPTATPGDDPVTSVAPGPDADSIIEDGLLYSLSEGGDFYYIVGIGSYKGGDLVIPASYRGLPIAIYPDAFHRCEGLVSVTVSEGVLEIGARAFRNIGSLTSVSIPSSVKTIRDGAFSGCENLQSVTIAEGVLRYGTEVFKGCRSLKSISIPRGTESIDKRTFDDCDSLTDIYYDGSRSEWEKVVKGVTIPEHITLHFSIYEPGTGPEVPPVTPDVPVPSVPETEEKEWEVLSTSEFALKVDEKYHKARVSVLGQGDETALRVEVLNEDGSVLCSHVWDGPGFVTATIETAENPFASEYFGVFNVTHDDDDRNQYVHAHYTLCTVHNGEIVTVRWDERTAEKYYLPIDSYYEHCISAYLSSPSFVAKNKNSVYSSFYRMVGKMDQNSKIVADSFFAEKPYTCSYEESSINQDDLDFMVDQFFDLFVAYAQKVFPRE